MIVFRPIITNLTNTSSLGTTVMVITLHSAILIELKSVRKGKCEYQIPSKHTKEKLEPSEKQEGHELVPPKSM